ncbi:acetyl-CoA C-acetyltransferase [Tuberibacillus sp. Marseille-P3662]|uniref:acetyl-CoA C-acetyltransferase n=1 Tax=Tuberibacillus sp. Marseille-P3662 TaxID=1965358 RepID=UPI000A1CC51D|nr:acetyl-CoA C-acetyltransferase [Tuberibacillus sp. Marseille-P3662]
MKDVYILDGARTPFGSFGKSLRKVSATEMGRLTAVEAMKRSSVEPEEVDQVIYGNVIHSSTNAAYISRHIALHAGVAQKTPALTVNRLCGSGLQAVVSAAQSIRLNEGHTALVGGAENMSMAPHSDFTSRFAGVKLGNLRLEDMLQSALTDEYNGCGMGVTAENLSDKYGLTREGQDKYAYTSHQRASRAIESGRFSEEIVPVEIKTRKGVQVFDQDEHVKKDTTQEALAALKPTFKIEGSVTAGNASGINDGAASLMIASEDYIQSGSQKPLAKILSWGVAGVDPTIMGIGPAPSSKIALERAGLGIEDMDLVEINEAFAAQYLAVEKELGLNRDITNVNGGAIALGHPVGASGSRILMTLAYELKRRGLRYGLASLCIGGGQGIAMVIENQL